MPHGAYRSHVGTDRSGGRDMVALTEDEYKAVDILIALNNRQLGQFVRSFFRSHNARSFQIVDDLALGLDALKTGAFNHLIVDFDLRLSQGGAPSLEDGEPGGIRLLRALRRFEGLRSEMPVMMVMREPSKERIYQARNSGVNEILGLPVTAQLVADRLYHIHKNPKPFVRVPTYIGPCRRRDRPTLFSGGERRTEDGDWNLQRTEY